MKRLNWPEEKIIALIREHEAGTPAKELCRRHGISEPTLHRWKAKYGGMDINEARKLKQLEDENRRLKKLVADLSLDNDALKTVLGKKW